MPVMAMCVKWVDYFLRFGMTPIYNVRDLLSIKVRKK